MTSVDCGERLLHQSSVLAAIERFYSSSLGRLSRAAVLNPKERIPSRKHRSSLRGCFRRERA